MRLGPSDIKDLDLLKHYRIIRKWAAKTNNLTDADLELLISLHCHGKFSRKDYDGGIITYGWDKTKWDRLLKQGWIVVWRKRNFTTQNHHVYEVSLRGKQLINRIYKIMLGTESLPTSAHNKIMRRKTYSDKVLSKAIHRVNNDKNK